MVLRQIASFVLWAATAVAQPDHVATCNLPCGGPEVPADCVSWTNMCETCSIPQPLARQAECAVRVQPDACGPLRSIFNSCSQSRTRFAEVNGLVPFVLTTHEEGYDEQRLMVELPPCTKAIALYGSFQAPMRMPPAETGSRLHVAEDQMVIGMEDALASWGPKRGFSVDNAAIFTLPPRELTQGEPYVDLGTLRIKRGSSERVAVVNLQVIHCNRQDVGDFRSERVENLTYNLAQAATSLPDTALAGH